jgi:hypothetical protein
MALVPVNGTAAIVVNQSGCSERDRINGLIEERRVLRGNVRAWNAELFAHPLMKRRLELVREIRRSSLRLEEIGRQLQQHPDARSASKYSTFDAAFRAAAKRTLPAPVLAEIDRLARELAGMKDGSER